MASARGDALDWALALARAPGERHVLRQRALPDGMETVLQVAGGSHAVAIDEAAIQAGMAPAEVVEAARFYLREMLFFPEADAYRVLGLAADASDEQVKHHHRLLQQWLHPDRPASDWDAAFAARVNAAWSQLRTPARREAYAATLALAGLAASEPGWSQPSRIHVPLTVADTLDAGPDEDRWRRRAPVLALFGVCAVLGVLAVRDMQREPDTGLADTEVVAVAPVEGAPTVALQLPAQASEAKVAIKAAPPPKRVAAAPAPGPAPTTVALKPILDNVAKPVPKPLSRPVAPSAAVAVASKTVPEPLPKPIAKPIAPPIVVAAAPKPSAAAVAPRPIRKPPVVVVAATPKAVATIPNAATALAPASLKPAVKPAIKPPPVAAANKPVDAVAKVTTPLPKPAFVAAQAPEPRPVVAAAPVAAPAAATPLTPSQPPVAAAANSPQQVAQAQQTGQRLLAYVSGRGGGMPPIWANLASQTQASRAREALQGNGRVEVGTPNWRVGGSSATMQASLSPSGGDARRLRVDLVWREQRWLVAGLSLEQAP